MSNNAKNAMKHSQNTTLTCLEAFKKNENTVFGSKIRFSAEMSNNAEQNHETLRKHQLNMFEAFWEFFFKIQFSAQNPVLGSDVEQCQNTLKHSENTNLTCLEALKKCENTVLGSYIRFSAQMSNNAKKNMKH